MILGTDGGLKTIVNVASVGGVLVSPGASAYQTTKLAILRLSEFLMVDHEKQGLLCYCIHPGGVATELALNMPAAMHKVLVDTPELGADTLVWLTKKRREWLGGRYISVNWDMQELLHDKERIVKNDLLKSRLAV